MLISNVGITVHLDKMVRIYFLILKMNSRTPLVSVNKKMEEQTINSAITRNINFCASQEHE
jgi:hypothetical protein